MQKIWQTEWFEIPFKEFAQLNPNQIATSEFYSNFYEIFYQRYKSFNEIEKSWLTEKENVAKDLFSMIQKNNAHSVISIGCGIGFIENCLVKLSEEKKYPPHLTAVEPAKKSTRWLSGKITFRQGFFPEVVADLHFDLAYTSIIDYAMNDEEYVSFLRKIYNSQLNKFVSVSLITGKHHWTAIDHIKSLISPVYRNIRPQQFWGYLRSLDEQIDLLTQAGFSQFEVGKHQNSNSYWITAS
ncbi:MAG: hypothetical protein VW829_09805 [Deltaproteobacteria bacterium]